MMKRKEVNEVMELYFRGGRIDDRGSQQDERAETI